MNIKCPCEKCICLAVCRHKQILRLFEDCSILYKYEPQFNLRKLRNEDRLFLLQKIMNPTAWEFGYIPNEPYQKNACIIYSGYSTKSKHLLEENPEPARFLFPTLN